MDSVTYEYTAQGWLKKMIFANGTTVVEVQFDNAGNRTAVIVTCSGSC